MIEKKAYAKVNLGLDIVGRRDDGYHLVKMIMQSLDIYDTLTFDVQESGIDISLAGKGGRSLSLGEDNLIYKAARCIMEKAGFSKGIRIVLDKNIPIAAGMAGGSSDCAATLKGVNELLSAGLTEEELMKIGVRLGADVPYCVEGGTVLAEGIGKKLTPLSELPEYVLAVAKPERGVSTGNIYKSLDEIFDTITHPDVDSMIDIINTSHGKGLSGYLGNVLEYVTIPLCPEVDEIKKLFRESGCEGTLMTGSGPTVFAFYENADKASRAIEKVRESGLCRDEELFVTTLTSPEKP